MIGVKMQYKAQYSFKHFKWKAVNSTQELPKDKQEGAKETHV